MAVIEVRNVHKSFRIPHEVHTTLTERVMHLFRPVTYERFDALRGVDLDVEPRSFVGIIGRNGSGKSTLLKIIAGLFAPDQGSVRVHGSMCELLELGLGFSVELTVRENVTLYASILGYPRRDLSRCVDEAIAFAELTRFRDAKLKSLSTGMCVRLGFATALQADCDILLLDEILAVGDAEFQSKCLGTFMDLKERGKTIVLVSHDMGQVERFCDEVVLFDDGRILARGAPRRIIERYRELTAAPAAGGAAG
jgi:ABC-type polysaccharide/polyol phosphate transport system ATPase subunit